MLSRRTPRYATPWIRPSSRRR